MWYNKGVVVRILRENYCAERLKNLNATTCLSMANLYINWWPLAILLAVTTLELFNKKGSIEKVFVSIIMILAGACALAFTEMWWWRFVWFVVIGGMATSDRGLGAKVEINCLVAAFTATVIGVVWLTNLFDVPNFGTTINFIIIFFAVILVRGSSKN